MKSLCRRSMWLLMFVLFAISICSMSSLAESVYTNKPEYNASFSTSTNFSEKIRILKEAFPDGKYWNYHSQEELGRGEQWKVTVNSKSYYVSTVGCVYTSGASHNGTTNDRKKCQSNHYSGTLGGTQCTGFARMIFKLLWNMEEGASSTVSVKYSQDSRCLELLLPGDIIWTGGHMLVVTEVVDAETIKYVDCNGDSHCKIMWTHSSSQQKLSYWEEKMKKNSRSYVSLHDPEASYAKRDGNDANDGIKINELNFPDITFRSYILEECDTDKNEILSDEEINKVTEFCFISTSISDLRGIEYFTSLKSLTCENLRGLTSINISKNTSLESLYIDWNGLTSLDVSNNKKLKILQC